MLLPPAILVLLATCFLVPLTIRWLIKAPAADSRLQPPPGPRGLPIVGYLPFLGPNLHQDFMNLAQQYGPIFKLSIGRKLCVIISSPALAKQVVRDHDVTFANRNLNVAASVFSYGGRDIAFSPYGAEWRLLRKIFVNNMQSKRSLDSFYPLRRKEVRKMVTELYDGGGGGGGEVDVGRVAFRTVIGMISGMFWGGTLGGDGSDGDVAEVVGGEFRSTASKLVEVLSRPNVSDFFPVLARFDLQGVEKEMKRVSGGMDKIFDFVIDRCIDGMKEKKPLIRVDDDLQQDFLHFLLEFRDHDTGKPISRQQIKALLMDIVIGGTDTSSTTIEWAMSELTQHPRVMERAQQELTRVVGPNNVVEESHIPDLLFLQAVMKETLRLHPVAPLLLPRCPTKACHVGGHVVPEGAKVFLNVWAMHRDPEYWNDPTSFLPERFLNEINGDSKSTDCLGGSFHYLPFGSGRRICAGLPLGERMVMYVLATLLHMFHWKVPKGVVLDTKEKFGVVLEKATPLVLVSTTRLSDLGLYE